jgi:dihydroxyacetone kinase DhaKLM complex PTS-EIIA-like component DhaM
MIGIVIVSHSAKLAEGVVELARNMGGADLRIQAAGGLNMPDQPLGTDAMLILGAIEAVYSDDGVLVLMDLGRRFERRNGCRNAVRRKAG